MRQAPSPSRLHDSVRALFLAPRDTSERNYQENYPDSSLTEPQAARPIHDLAGQGFFPGPHQGQPEPFKPQPGYQPADETSAGHSYWSPQFDQTTPSTRYSLGGRDIPDPDLAGGGGNIPHFPPEMGESPNLVATRGLSTRQVRLVVPTIRILADTIWQSGFRRRP